MLNLNEVSGVKSSPISKNILENSIGNNTLKDSRAYSNYEFLVDSIENGSFRAPSVILASGSGGFYPKTAEYQNNFYSANIFGRDDYLNSWQESYRTDEAFELTYYDGSTIFREFKIDPGTGRGKIKSLETRNGNLPGQAGFTQFIMGYNADASVDDVGFYRHNFRTRHSSTNNNENAIDVFLWDSSKDSKTALGSRRVISLYGNGNFELVSGTSIFGPVNISISTTAEKNTERDTLAVDGKGVIYFNETTNKLRYSEDGGLFKNFGAGSGADFALETCSLNKCSLVNTPTHTGDKNQNNVKNFSFVVRMYSHKKAKIKKIYVPTVGGSMQVAIYSDEINEFSENGPSRYSSEQLIAYSKQYAGRNAGGAGSPFYTPFSVQLDNPTYWEFYDRYNANPSTTITEAIVAGSFSIAISVSWDQTETISSVMAELLPYYISDPTKIDNLTNNGTNGMNFEMLTYDMANDTNPTSSSNYTLHSNKADRVSMSITQQHFQKLLNFVPYIKVVLEPVEA